MPAFRFPFGNDVAWAISQGNWDDPNQGAAHDKNYAFDLTHPVGAEIHATRAGVVIDIISTATKNSWPTVPGNPCDPTVPAGGNGVLIRHCDDTVSTYAHLQFGAIQVQVGSWVAQGQTIALSGNTGCSSEPHCHFEVFLNGTSYQQLGPSIPIDFDLGGGLWRPRAGDPIAVNNTVLRQDGWRWCNKCQGLFFGGAAAAGSLGGLCPFDHQPHSSAGSGSYILAQQETDAFSQPGWRWCSKCQGLFVANPGSVCPAGMGHVSSGGFYVLTNNSPNAPGQSNWRWCHKCQGLFFGGGANGGRCPADQQAHSSTGSGNYTLAEDQGVAVADVWQPGWRYCSRCQGMFYGTNQAASKCPAGGGHTDNGGHYVMTHTSPNAPGQEPWAGLAQGNWRWCSKCQGLFFGGTPNVGSPGGRCPADQGQHSGASSGDYRLVRDAPLLKGGDTKAPGQNQWRWCSKCQGLFFGGMVTSGTFGGTCPADQGTHQGSNSGDYAVLTSGV